MKISCVRARPLTFFMRQGKAPPDIPENVAGSGDCFTGDTVCRLLMKKRGQINMFHWKIFRKKLKAKKFRKTGGSRIFIMKKLMSCEGCYFGLLWGLCRCWALLKFVYYEWWCHEC